LPVLTKQSSMKGITPRLMRLKREKEGGGRAIFCCREGECAGEVKKRIPICSSAYEGEGERKKRKTWTVQFRKLGDTVKGLDRKKEKRSTAFFQREGGLPYHMLDTNREGVPSLEHRRGKSTPFLGGGRGKRGERSITW